MRQALKCLWQTSFMHLLHQNSCHGTHNNKVEWSLADFGARQNVMIPAAYVCSGVRLCVKLKEVLNGDGWGGLGEWLRCDNFLFKYSETIVFFLLLVFLRQKGERTVRNTKNLLKNYRFLLQLILLNITDFYLSSPHQAKSICFEMIKKIETEKQTVLFCRYFVLNKHKQHSCCWWTFLLQ